MGRRKRAQNDHRVIRRYYSLFLIGFLWTVASLANVLFLLQKGILFRGVPR